MPAETAGGDAAPASGVPSQKRAGNGSALVVAFIAGGLLVLFLTALFSSHPVTPPAMPPAAVSVPVEPPAIPLKRRRAHGSRRAKATTIPHSLASQAVSTTQLQPNSVPDALPPV